jgi:hypothetical protein
VTKAGRRFSSTHDSYRGIFGLEAAHLDLCSTDIERWFTPFPLGGRVAGHYKRGEASEMKALKIITWTCYLTGTLLVFLNYLGVVGSGLAWIGWGVGMLGWAVISFGPRFLPPPEEVADIENSKVK